MLNDIGEAETTKSDLLLNGILGLSDVSLREWLVGLNSRVHSVFRYLEALSGPLSDIEVLPLSVG